MAALAEQHDTSPAEPVVPYQNLLRSIGAHLDEHQASQISVLEDDDSFLARYQSRPPTDVQSVRFGLDDLTLWDRRRRGQRTGPRNDKPPARGGYQDVLRAFGYELEHTGATRLILDELDGTYILTYYSPDFAGGPVLRKRRIVVTPAETENVLRRARGRRRATSSGWLLDSSQSAAGPVRLVRITDAEPVFQPAPDLVYEYTIPALTARSTSAILQTVNAHVSGVYRAHRVTQTVASSPEERLLKPFEAAQLISAVYARCLDPIRFPGTSRESQGKAQALAAFTRHLTTQKVRAAVDLVARHVEDIRSLDGYQTRVGTNTVRWMQYLATEVLASHEPELSRDYPNLVTALATIRRSETVADRFAAIRQFSPTSG